MSVIHHVGNFSIGYEPYHVAPVEAPLFDERFVGLKANKVMHVSNL